MDKFTVLNGLAAPMDRANVDTDAIIPKQFLKSIRRSGFGPNLFDEWRYMDHGEPGMDNSKRPRNPNFVLNQERYQGAQVLLARENFGCGSSREHAPWALHDYGFRALIAPSYADIFYSNSFKNGLLPIVLDAGTVDRLFHEAAAQPGYKLRIDLPAQTVTTPGGEVFRFDIDPTRKNNLVNGLDEIGLTLAHRDEIAEYEDRHKHQQPWLYS